VGSNGFQERVRDDRGTVELRAANQKKAKQLISKAKKLVRSDDWKEAGDAIKGLQQDWKSVNPLPQNVADPSQL
jgi:hypothetical protein